MGWKLIWSMALAGLACLAVLACSGDSSERGKPIAEINGYVLTENEFKERIVATRQIYGGQALSWDDKKRYLDREIDKELLIQAAVKLGLDRQSKFREAMQRFWEQTLITELFKEKARQLQKQIVVTEQEVQARYRQMCQEDPQCPPLQKIRERLEKELSEAKQQKALDEWLKKMREQASITIYEENLRALR